MTMLDPDHRMEVEADIVQRTALFTVTVDNNHDWYLRDMREGCRVLGLDHEVSLNYFMREVSVYGDDTVTPEEVVDVGHRGVHRGSPQHIFDIVFANTFLPG